MAIYGHKIRDFDNFNIAYSNQHFYMVARNVSGSYCFFNVNLQGQILRPFYYIDGRLPTQSEQNNKISIDNGAVDDDIIIDHYPFVPITKGFIDAREGTTLSNYSDDDLLIQKQPIISKDPSGNSVVGINSTSWTSMRQGVEVARGKPSVILTPSGCSIVVYTYSENFSAGAINATCPPFIGRIYATASFDGMNWTPPICLLNLSLFNPEEKVFSMHFSNMLTYFDETTNPFSASYNKEFYNETSGLRSVQKLNATEIENISCQDFGATYDNATNSYVLSFWFGGFICYRDISQEVALTLDWAAKIRNTRSSVGSEKEPYHSTRFSPIYDLKNPAGEYIYTKAFWSTTGPREIYIVAGPMDRLISNSATSSPVPRPGEEPIAVTILKAIGGAQARNNITNLNIATDAPALIQNRYDPTWKGVFPPGIIPKFDNLEYSGEQVKQSPGIGIGSVGETMVAFYSSSNNISYIPVRDYNRIILSGYPKLLISD